MTSEDGGPEAPEEPTAARDGDVDADELARRRASRNGETNGSSLADRAGEDDDPVPNADEQFEFELVEQGKTVTLSQLIARGTPTIQEWKFEGMSVKGSGGLVPFSRPDLLLLVDGRAGKVEVDPTYDDEGKVEKVTIRPHVKARYVMDARTEQARVRFGEAQPDAAIAEG